MSPKKRSSDSIEPETKKGKKSVVDVSRIPTPSAKEAEVDAMAKFLDVDIQVPLKDELQDLRKMQPAAHAGICAFGKEAYIENMTKHRQYECNTLVTDHKLGNHEFEPVVGSIIRLAKTGWHERVADERGNTKDIPSPKAFANAIIVRATTSSDADAGLLMMEPIHNSTSVTAFLYAWAQAKKQGMDTEVLQKFMEVAMSVRTRFMLITDEDEFEREKWNRMETQSETAENQEVFGYHRIKAVMKVKLMLLERKVASDVNAVTAWCRTIRWAAASEQIGSKAVALCFRVAQRIEGSPTVGLRLETLSSMYGKNHSLASMYTLDAACKATKVSIPKLESALLLWVVEGIVVLHLRRELPLNTSGKILESKYFPCLLLLRRVVGYLLGKFTFKDEGFEEAPPARKPSLLLGKIFNSFASFHNAFPKGFSFEDAHAQSRSSSAFVSSAGHRSEMDAAQDGPTIVTPVASSTWVSQYGEVQRDLLEFLRKLMELPKVVMDIFVKALNQNPNARAEEVMAMKDWKAEGIFDLDEVLHQHRKTQLNDAPEEPGPADDGGMSKPEPPPAESEGGELNEEVPPVENKDDSEKVSAISVK